MPSRAPRDSPKPIFLTAKQRKRLDRVPQTIPIRTRRTISFIEQFSEINDLAYGLPGPRSMQSSSVFVSMKSDIMVSTLVDWIGRAIAHPSSGTYRWRSEIIPAAPESEIGE